MLVLLVGFMGSGKTTMLQKLSNSSSSNHSWQTIDLDQKILQDFGPNEESLGEFIRKQGMPQFRQFERQALEELLSQQDSGHRLVALGGGCLGESGDESSNWQLLLRRDSDDIKILWLATPFEQCWQRIKDGKERPLVDDMGRDELRKLYEKRERVYGRAHVTLTPDQQEEIQTFADLERFLAASE